MAPNLLSIFGRKTTMKYRQDPPFSVQVEFTEGCNRGCGFCGLQGMRKGGKKPFYFMTKETATRIADEIANLICFYARTRENAEEMMKPWEA